MTDKSDLMDISADEFMDIEGITLPKDIPDKNKAVDKVEQTEPAMELDIEFTDPYQQIEKNIKKKDKEEKDDEDVETKTPKSKETKQEETEVDVNALYEWEKQNGFIDFDLPEDFDGNLDTYKELRQKAEEDKIETIISNIDNDHGGVIKYLLNGGKIEDFVKLAADDFSKVTIDEVKKDSNKAEKIVRQFYKYKDFDNEDIEEEVTKLKDLEDLESKAAKLLPKVQEYSKKLKEQEFKKLEQAKQEQEKKQRDFFNSVSKNIDNTKEFLGVPMTSELKKKVKGDVESGATLKKINDNLDKYLPTLALLDRLKVLDGDTSKVANYFKSNATKEVQNTIKKIPFQSGKANKVVDDTDIIESIGNVFKGYM